jgi:hypothetical protein
MAQIIDLGKIRFSYQGTYNPATEYEVNDVVKYGGNIYVYINATATTGNTPTNTTYWSLMVEGFKFQGSWSSATAYKVGDAVAFGGTIYLSVADNTNQQPPNATYWSKFIEGLQYEGAYDNSTQYQKADVVRFGNNVYIATQTTTGNIPTNVTYWDTLVEGINFEGVYSGSTTYQENDIVSYGGSSYIALQETTGNAPTDPTFWALLADGTFPDQTGNAGRFLSTDGTQTLWTSDINIDALTVNETLYVGTGAEAFETAAELTNSVAVFQFDNGTEDSTFAQLAFQNTDPTSSTDIIAYMDEGNDSTGWVGIGITGSNFDDETFGITGPGDGYIFHETAGDPGDYTGNLVFATGANGSENKLVFAAGGFDSGLTQMEITPGVNVHVEIPTPSTSPTTGAFTVVGGVGIQGDMNIQGDVNIVGEISFGGSGTTVTTQNLAVSDPVIFAGSNNLSDVVDLGLVGEYAEDVVDQVTSVNNKALTSNVATLTTTAAHGYSTGDVVVVTGVDSTFNGTYVITDVPTTTTFKYAKTAGNVASAAVSPTGTATVTHERRWGGVVRDVSDGAKIKFFQGLTTKPTNTVDFTNAGLTFAPIRAGNAEFGTISGTSITTSGGTSTLAGTVNITSAANFTGANVTLGSGTWSGAPTFSGNITFSGSPTFTGTPSFTGGIRVQELLEDIVDVTHSSNAIPIDYSLGNVFFLTNSLSANATVNMTNVPTDNGRAFTVNILVTQGSTGYVPTTLNINGSNVTIRWASGVTPTPTSSNGKIDIFTFTVFRRSSTFTAFGSVNANF